MLFLTFCVFFAACCAAGATGAMFPPGPWYESLKKPAWVPPNWMFPVIWTTLYFLMSYAAARVAMVPDTGFALAFWALQIALNTLWTPVFFGLQKMQTALYVMLGLWTSVLLTLLAFAVVDTIAGLLFVPYLIWVSVAGALNYAVWRMNPNESAG